MGKIRQVLIWLTRSPQSPRWSYLPIRSIILTMAKLQQQATDVLKSPPFPRKSDSKMWPKILTVRRTAISPWLEVIEREVQFSGERESETYYAVGQPDYIVVFAITPAQELLLVRQYRPAIERFSLELPGGLAEPNEIHAETACRELLEETGYRAQAIEKLGSGATCSGKISNLTHSFFVKTEERVAHFRPNPIFRCRCTFGCDLRASADW